MGLAKMEKLWIGNDGLSPGKLQGDARGDGGRQNGRKPVLEAGPSRFGWL